MYKFKALCLASHARYTYTKRDWDGAQSSAWLWNDAFFSPQSMQERESMPMHWTAHYIDCYIFKIHLLITKTCQMSLWCAKEGKNVSKQSKKQRRNKRTIVNKSPLNNVRSIWTENNTLFHSVYMVILGECASACLFFFLVVSRLRFFSKALFPNPLKCTTLKFTHRFSRCHANSVLIKWGKFEKCSEKVAFGSQWLKMFVLNSWRIDHITYFVRLTHLLCPKVFCACFVHIT